MSAILYMMSGSGQHRRKRGFALGTRVTFLMPLQACFRNNCGRAITDRCPHQRKIGELPVTENKVRPHRTAGYL